MFGGERTDGEGQNDSSRSRVFFGFHLLLARVVVFHYLVQILMQTVKQQLAAFDFRRQKIANAVLEFLHVHYRQGHWYFFN